MGEHLLIGLAAVIVLGIGAQWLAWRIRVPSILLLLILGFLAGPVTGFLTMESLPLLSNDIIFPFVSLSVGIILFEGGLSLRLDELREVGAAVRNLISVGALVTWSGATLAGYYILGFDFEIALLLGSLLVVTGPTVVIPLLRHVRPTGRVGATAKWEGIMNDPVGAILAVLVLETILLLSEMHGGAGAGLGEALAHVLEGLFLTLFVALGVAVAGSALLVLMLRQRMVPDFLQNSVALMMVVAAFAASNTLQEESGLLATTLMGIAMANQRWVAVNRIIEFKEDLRVLLIGTLFILLSVRLEPSDLQYIGTASFVFLAVLMLVVRPLAVWVSALGTALSFKEQAFLAWLAPRGIVAAAVAALFSIRLEALYPLQSARFVPIVFLVIVGTVAIYGLTITPLARWLGLALPNPQGVLLVGAHSWARAIGRVLRDQGIEVQLVDANAANAEQAEAEGLQAHQVNILDEHVMEHLDLGGIGRILALTPNDEVNSLAALHFTEVFESTEVYQVPTRTGERGKGDLPQHLRGRPLFPRGTTYTSLCERFERGATIETVRLTGDFDYDAFAEHFGDAALPLFVIPSPGNLEVVTADQTLSPSAGATLVALVDPSADRLRVPDETEAEKVANG